MVQFFQTLMGKRHYEHTMPELVRQLALLNKNLEALLVRMGPLAGGAQKQDQG